VDDLAHQPSADDERRAADHPQPGRPTSAPPSAPPSAQALEPERLQDVPLSRPIADRAAQRRGDALVPELLADPATRVLEIAAGRARLDASGRRLLLRAPEPADGDRLAAFLGHDEDGVAHLAVRVDLPDDAAEQEGAAEREGWQGLRALAPVLDDAEAGLAVQAVAVFNWHATHGFCPRCGAATTVTSAGWARHCPADGSDHWPRTDPAVIMTVVDDHDRLLLGRHTQWPSGRFSTLAGFVEPGESLETAVRREVKEEVGVDVGDVTYLGSQPWPFPSSVMLGFRGRALTTDLAPDGEEIAEARWFTREGLLEEVRAGTVGLSPRLSISRALVEHWYGGRLPDPPR
jgi:NAD+ diphosphatase